MSALIPNPFTLFPDLAGRPLDNGKIYIGQPNLDPKDHPIDVYWDQELTVAAVQPIPTLGGLMFNDNAPGMIYADVDDFSVRVLDKNGRQIYFVQSMKERNLLNVGKGLPDSSVSITPLYPGAVARAQRARNGDVMSIKDFKTTGSPYATQDEILTAVTALNDAGGGRLEIPFGTVLLVEEDIEIPDHVTISGPFRYPGSKKDNTVTSYEDRQNFIIGEDATVSLGGSSGVSGCIVARQGLVYGSATEHNNFAGTAFKAAGDDAFLHENLIMGFNQAYFSDGYQRAKIGHNNIDCTNGIYLTNTYDIARIFDNHCWGFTMVSSGVATATLRNGVAYYLDGHNDWVELLDNFSYGYYRGTYINGGSAAQIRVQHDSALDSSGNPLFDGQIGIVIEGSANRTQLLKAHINSHPIGIYISNPDFQDQAVGMIENAVITSGDTGIYVAAGDLKFGNCIFTDLTYGVVSNAASQKIMSNSANTFNSTVDKPYHCEGGSLINFSVKDDIFFKPDGYTLTAIGNVMPYPVTVASNQINLPTSRNMFGVSGGTIRQIAGCLPEREITLVFTGETTLEQNTGLTNYIFMPGTGGSKTYASGEIARLVCVGLNWVLM